MAFPLKQQNALTAGRERVVVSHDKIVRTIAMQEKYLRLQFVSLKKWVEREQFRGGTFVPAKSRPFYPIPDWPSLSQADHRDAFEAGAVEPTASADIFACPRFTTGTTERRGQIAGEANGIVTGALDSASGVEPD